LSRRRPADCSLEKYRNPAPCGVTGFFIFMIMARRNSNMKQKKLMAVILSLAVFLGACKDEITTPNPEDGIDWKNYTAAGEFSI
jgi:succinate-acetate transporter protein